MSEYEFGRFKVKVDRRNRKVFGRRQHGMRLVVSQDGTLTVRAPQRTSMADIKEFVLAHTDWIETQQGRAADWRAKNPRPRIVAGERFLFFGRECELVIEHEPEAKRASVEAIESYLIVRTPDTSEEAVGGALQRFYEKQARLLLGERVPTLAAKMGVQPSGISFRRQKTRWGSCSPDGHLSFNWKLIFAPEVVIDYVIIHELAHLIHANHSDRFWSVVEKYDHDHLANRRWLRVHQHRADFLSLY